MIFGCPDRFAIYFDKVDCWSNDNFNEGIIGFYINNNLFHKYIDQYVSTLDINICDLQKYFLQKSSINKVLFKKEKLALCKYLLKNRYPAQVFNSQEEYDDYPDNLYVEEELIYSIDINFLSKANLSMFIIKSLSKARILILNLGDIVDFFNLSNLKENEIVEVIISLEELKNIIDQSIFSFYVMSNRPNRIPPKKMSDF